LHQQRALHHQGREGTRDERTIAGEQSVHVPTEQVGSFSGVRLDTVARRDGRTLSGQHLYTLHQEQ
jgi:hypothetical protein